MSASLVGSEMCIRDRATADGLRMDCGLVPGQAVRPDCWMADNDSGLLSVSYTHLTLPTICSV
eukprot:9547302-Alexandrium_andersonii.AAC.1